MTVIACPHCGSKVEAGLSGCTICFGSLGTGPEGPPVLACGDDWVRTLQGCEVLGGYGYPLPMRRPLRVTIDPAGVHFVGEDVSEDIPMDAVTAMEIGGPGKTTRGGGFIGGGFGLEGAATGMLVATALNALTARTDLLTVISIQAHNAEVWLAYTRAEPAALRVELAPAFVRIRQNNRART